MVEQQAEVGPTLEQLARHIALGAARQLHFQQREGPPQRFQAGEHGLVGHGFVLGQPQPGLLSPRQPEGATVQALALAQHLARLLQQGRTRLRQAWLAPAAALEQLHAEVFFQQCDAAADRRLGAAQLPGHGGKGLPLGDADEQANLLQIPLHDWSPISKTDR
ncbi:hypothetical protein D9M68_514280 [compost metagenome]